MKVKFYIVYFLFFISCNKEYNTIGTDFLRSDTFDTNVEYVDVAVKQKRIPPFKSIALPIYQLGKIQDQIFGNRDATFVTQLGLEELNPILASSI